MEQITVVGREIESIEMWDVWRIEYPAEVSGDWWLWREATDLVRCCCVDQ